MISLRSALPLFAVAAVAGCMAEARFGSSVYAIDGSSYRVPHTHDRFREGQPAWLAGVTGLDEDGDTALGLNFPADEAAKGIAGYSRTFAAYTGTGTNGLSVTVIGGRDAREFPDDRAGDLAELTRWRAPPAHDERDPETGWQRVFDARGGGRAAGIPSFALLPPQGAAALPANWRVPQCAMSPDRAGRMHSECRYEISERGLTYAFTLNEGSLAAAPRVPGFVRSQLATWSD